MGNFSSYPDQHVDGGGPVAVGHAIAVAGVGHNNAAMGAIFPVADDIVIGGAGAPIVLPLNLNINLFGCNDVRFNVDIYVGHIGDDVALNVAGNATINLFGNLDIN